MSQGFVLLRKENINLFRLPTVGVGKGHYLDSWKEKIWIGKITRKSFDKNRSGFRNRGATRL